MIFLAYFFVIPLAYLATLLFLATKRDVRSISVSLLLFVGTVGADWWDITRSRSSTAAIGFLFVPMIASVAGLCGVAFSRWQRSESRPLTALAWVALVCGVAVIGASVVDGRRTMAKNETRDNQQALFSAEIARDREEIAAKLIANKGRERAWLDSAIRARITDRAFLLAALPNDSVSPAVLDTVATGSDLNVTLEAIRNPNTRAETLERVYRTASYPDYFFQALAAHRNTPPSLLRALHQNPGVISGLDIWLSGNPSSPQDVLGDIARKTTDRNVVAALLENPSINCTTMSALAKNLMNKQNRDADNPNVARLTERMPAVCTNAPAG